MSLGANVFVADLALLLVSINADECMLCASGTDRLRGLCYERLFAPRFTERAANNEKLSRTVHGALEQRWTNTHTHTHPYNGPFPGTTRVSWYQKGKTNLDFTEARDSEWQWHQLGRMQVCTSLQTDNHASTTPLGFFTGNKQRQSTEGRWTRQNKIVFSYRTWHYLLYTRAAAPVMHRSIDVSPTRRAHSSKPATRCCSGWMGQAEFVCLRTFNEKNRISLQRWKTGS